MKTSTEEPTESHSGYIPGHGNLRVGDLNSDEFVETVEGVVLAVSKE